MRTKTLAAVAALTAVAAPATAQTLLDQLLAKVVKPKAGSSAPGSAAAAGAGPDAMLASITPAQTATVDRLLAAPAQDQRVVADRTAAAPLAKALLATASCAQRGAAFNVLSRRMLQPRQFDTWVYTPMVGMKYHGQATCLDVVRLTDWSKPALNALAFTAYYVAPDSGEAAHQRYELQKSPDGEWLIRDVSQVER